ncbi:hypothetical protein [Arenibacter sp. NBRC 103722]|uniref:hypothetical protein n=1 Tax=Arenibacter sp. NBRC 103722 TaxID=1113929 RepID=UPI0008530410|nr:hypothetical protein [Arenibacter sp. NBRC 103722]
MINETTLLYYTTSIEMVLKELRAEKGINMGLTKPASQSFINTDFEHKYGITINMGRNESNPNFEMKTLFYLCDYFKISIIDFFKRVSNIHEKEIIQFLEDKGKRKKSRTKK